MASDFPDGSRQVDWELFPPDDYADELYFDNSADATIDQVEGADGNEQNPLAILQPREPCPDFEANGLVKWNSAACATPTQPPTAFVSSYFPTTPSATAEATNMTAATPARQSVSPSSSPRLPSPPPYTEVQIGPKSPSISQRDEHNFLAGARREDESSSRRIRPGTKAADMASGPPLVPLAQLDSPFQLQEHLKALYHTYTRSSDSSSTTPITRDTALILASPPEGIDRQLWLYELCRFLTMRANNLIIAFFAESPPCSSHTCPEMRASEWQYLCAVHDPPKSCCAIDYCCHTLDWATNVLTSPKFFPSRLTLGSEAAGGAQASMRHLTNIFRRVYRIFAHAWFQHRGVFWQVEGHDGLYVFFKTVCDAYALIPEDNYTIPLEAEGHEMNLETPISTSSDQHISILKNNNKKTDPAGTAGPANSVNDSTGNSVEPPIAEGEATTTISTGATTRRHKHTPSIGTNVTTIAESEEDETSDTRESEQQQAPSLDSHPPNPATVSTEAATAAPALSSSTNESDPPTSSSEPSSAAATDAPDPDPSVAPAEGEHQEREGEAATAESAAAAQDVQAPLPPSITLTQDSNDAAAAAAADDAGPEAAEGEDATAADPTTGTGGSGEGEGEGDEKKKDGEDAEDVVVRLAATDHGQQQQQQQQEEEQAGEGQAADGGA